MQTRNDVAIPSGKRAGGPPSEEAAAGLEDGWDPSRWATLLDRIDVRLGDVGLKYWGPPLWLEVTMTGPDSDLWPTVSSQEHSWNWQSSEACATVAEMADNGAGDVELLAVAGRYTLENLVLNAVHEIGEWLRFDGERLFHSHAPLGPSAGPTSDQGNGPVEISFSYATGPFATGEAGERRVGAAAEPSAPEEPLAGPQARGAGRFTYLPGVSITFTTDGPLVESATERVPSGAGSPDVDALALKLGVTWSQRTLQAVALGEETGLRASARDVHRALVAYETQRICGALYIDSQTKWHLDGVCEADAVSPKGPGLPAEPGLMGASNASAPTTGIRISVGYNGTA